MSINPFRPPPNPKLSKTPKIIKLIEEFFRIKFLLNNDVYVIKPKKNVIKLRFT